MSSQVTTSPPSLQIPTSPPPIAHRDYSFSRIVTILPSNPTRDTHTHKRMQNQSDTSRKANGIAPVIYSPQISLERGFQFNFKMIYTDFALNRLTIIFRVFALGFPISTSLISQISLIWKWVNEIAQLYGPFIHFHPKFTHTSDSHEAWIFHGLEVDKLTTYYIDIPNDDLCQVLGWKRNRSHCSTNPNNVLLKNNPLKITIDLQQPSCP